MEKKKKPQQGQNRASWTPVPQTPAATPSSQSVQANHSLEDLPFVDTMRGLRIGDKGIM